MRERLYLDALSEVFANTSKVMVDVSEDSPLLYLPLDQRPGGGSGSAGSDASQGQQGELDPRVLERMRSSQPSNSSTGSNSSNSGIRREGR